MVIVYMIKWGRGEGGRGEGHYKRGGESGSLHIALGSVINTVCIIVLWASYVLTCLSKIALTHFRNNLIGGEDTTTTLGKGQGLVVILPQYAIIRCHGYTETPFS